MSVQDLEKKTVREIFLLKKDLEKELFSLKMKNAIRSLKQTHLIRLVRRNIARINHVLARKIKENYGNHMN